MKPINALSVLTLVLFSSCSVLYMPDRINSPGFTDAKEFRTDLCGGTNGAYSVAVDYSPLRHLGLISSFDKTFNATCTNSGSDDKYVINGYRYNLGLGYYSSINKELKYEVYAGFGSGSFHADPYRDPTRATNYSQQPFDGNYNRYFLQAALGVDRKAVVMIYGIRSSFQKYYSTDAFIEHLLPEPASLSNNYLIFIEPFIGFETGSIVKLNAQLSTANQIGGPEIFNTSVIPLNSLTITIGLSLHFGGKK